MTLTVSRKAHFNAAHRLYRPDWSDEKNREVFGKCSNPNFHGHNYELIASVTGPIDPETGFVIDVKVLKDLIKTQVEDAFDHKNLNLDVDDFSSLNPTAEHIAVAIYNRLKPHLKAGLHLEITLYETPRNFVSYKGISL
jgi:6-pyruvoyltetrahydropterin/6-carboxytetrahydropterin synthase